MIMNKDVLFTIYEILHRDLTKQLIAEYHKRLGRCKSNIICNIICKCYISFHHYNIYWFAKKYNYRLLRDYKYSEIYTKNDQSCCDLSKNY